MGASLTRRGFLAGSTAAVAAAQSSAPARRGANDRITVGMIAAGARAQELMDAINSIEDAEITGVCDAYTGRVERAVARTGGRAKVYPGYREILADKSIDTVVVGSPDHWHHRHVVDSLLAGKDVYCEKPLTYSVDEGLEIAEAVKQSGRLLQVGSQSMSSLVQQKAREWIHSGKLGQVTTIRAAYNRNTADGAWIYPIPPDASPKTVDWEMFLGPAKKRPFSPERFFRWRCYRDYSGGIATDLFVHVCTTIHYIMGAKMPSKVTAMGQLYRWTESRNVPDTLNAILEYPEGFTVNLGSTFNNQYSPEGSFQVLGTEGSLLIDYTGLRFVPETPRENNGWIVRSWPSALEREYYQDPKVRQEEMPWAQPPDLASVGEEFRQSGWEPTVQHLRNFFDAVRNRQPVVQDAMAGHHAAACAHLINYSAETGRFAYWDFERSRQKI